MPRTRHASFSIRSQILQGVEAISSVAGAGSGFAIVAARLWLTSVNSRLQIPPGENLLRTLFLRSGLEGFSRLFFSLSSAFLAITSACHRRDFSPCSCPFLALAFCCLLLCARLMLGFFFLIHPAPASFVCFELPFCPLEFSTPDHLESQLTVELKRDYFVK